MVCPVATVYPEIANCFALVLRALVANKGLVHRDISYNNILLCEPQVMDNKEEDCHHGLLIDFEYAALLATPQSTSPGQRTVSVNFLVIILKFLFFTREQLLLWQLNFF